jgi:ribosomal protein L20
MQRTVVALPSESISIAASKLFTYPTRMANCWAPAIQEIYLSGYLRSRPRTEILVEDNATSTGRKKKAVNLWTGYRGAISNIYRSLLPTIEMNADYVFDARYDADGNISHVLINIAPAALMVQRAIPSVVAVLRADATAMARTALNLLQIPILCTDSDVIGKIARISQEGPIRGNGVFNGDGLYSSVFDTVSFDGYEKSTPERIFISRRGTRNLLNETEIEQLVKRYGFEKVYFEDIPLARQWSLARNAKAVVGMHGAALASLTFNRNAVKVVELFHPGYVTRHYRELINAVGGSWCGVTGKLPLDIIKQLDFRQKPRHFALYPTELDATSVTMALKNLGID